MSIVKHHSLSHCIKRHRIALRDIYPIVPTQPHPSGAAYTVHIRLDVLRDVEVDHGAYVLDIKASRCYICCY